MQGKAFLDTNILLYGYSSFDTRKQLISRELMLISGCTVSTQVLQEYCNVVHKKLGEPYSKIQVALKELVENLYVHHNSSHTVEHACAIAHRYGFSFYDSMIVAAAEECGCEILYSEDLQHEQKINGMKIIKPALICVIHTPAGQ